MMDGKRDLVRTEEVRAMGLALNDTEESDLLFVFGWVTGAVKENVERLFGKPCADSDLNPSVMHAASERLQQWLNLCRDEQIDPVVVIVVLCPDLPHAHKRSLSGVFDRLKGGLAAYDALEQKQGVPLPTGGHQLAGTRTVRRMRPKQLEKPMDQAVVLLLRFVGYCHLHCLNVGAVMRLLFGTLLIRLDDRGRNPQSEAGLYLNVLGDLRKPRL